MVLIWTMILIPVINCFSLKKNDVQHALCFKYVAQGLLKHYKKNGRMIFFQVMVRVLLVGDTTKIQRITSLFIVFVFHLCVRRNLKRIIYT